MRGRIRRNAPSIDGRVVRIMGSKAGLLKTIASGVETATIGVPSFVPRWRATRDEEQYWWARIVPSRAKQT